MKMLHGCRVTHVLWEIPGVVFGDDIYFHICSEEGTMSCKNQIKFQNKKLSETFLSSSFILGFKNVIWPEVRPLQVSRLRSKSDVISFSGQRPFHSHSQSQFQLLHYIARHVLCLLAPAKSCLFSLEMQSSSSATQPGPKFIPGRAICRA